MTSITMTTMSGYAQFGYPYSSASQLLMSGAAGMAPPLSSMGPATTSPTGPCSASASATSPGSTTSTSAGQGASSPCCDSGRPLVTDPVTGQAVCPCQYDRLALSAYSPSAAAAAARLAAVSAASAVSGVGLHGVYSAAYSSSDQNPYPSLGMDGSAFYSLGNPYIKDGGAGDVSAWSSSGLQTAPGYYPYDPALAAYGYGAGYDLAARRKNATRESTATLKAWLSEHKKNPYPTKGEKIMLAIITKMTLTQVSTWFANARRRLKKENKMTWEPKNRQEDDDDGDDEVSGQSDDDSKAKDKKDNADSDINDKDDDDKSDSEGEEPRHPHHLGSHLNVSVNNCGPNDIMPPCQVSHPGAGVSNVPLSLLHRGDGAKSPSKPKIWSLADTAACKTPPPPPGLDGMNPSASSMSMGSHHPSSHPHSHHHHHHHHHQQWMTGGTMPSSYGPMPSMNKFAAAAAAGFNPYGRYPGFGPAGYGPAASHYNPAASYSNMVMSGNHAGHGYSDTVPSTDTPPQTPPNLKLPMLGQYMSPSSTPSATATVSMLASNLHVPIPPSHHHAHHRLMGPNNTGAQTVPDRPGSDLPSPTGSSVSSMSSSSSSSASANPAGNLSMSGNLLPQQHSPDTSAAAFRPVYRGSPGCGTTAGYMS